MSSAPVGYASYTTEEIPALRNAIAVTAPAIPRPMINAFTQLTVSIRQRYRKGPPNSWVPGVPGR